MREEMRFYDYPPLSIARFGRIIKVMLLDALVYFVDYICTQHAVVHLVFGVFFGILLGHAWPSLGFWSASVIGFFKEAVDYFKHAQQILDFNYFTDNHYGLLDAYGDWFFWMLGGYMAYRLLRRCQGVAVKRSLTFIDCGTLQPVEVTSRRSVVGQRSVHWESHR